MTTDVPENAPERVAKEIAAYLLARPQAIDTARGIREWWLRHLNPPPDISTIILALEALEAAGVVRRIVLDDQSVLWAAA
jgi:hypothetical protein